MGKKRAKESNVYRDSVDPRFSGIFTSSNTKNAPEDSSIASQPSMIVATSATHGEIGENEGFQNFLSKKLAEYLDSHIKEVDRPVSEPDFFSNKLESIQIFSDSNVITEEKIEESIKKRPEKKKRKKERSDKELLKEVVVSYDWLQRQAQILNS